jgi:hypothetical protein
MMPEMVQSSLFDASKGEAEKEYGQILAEINSGGFVPVMRRLAVSLSHLNGFVTVDDLRKWAAARNVEPHHPNAWGALFRCGFIPVGRAKSTLVSNHSRWVFQWKAE